MTVLLVLIGFLLATNLFTIYLLRRKKPSDLSQVVEKLYKSGCTIEIHPGDPKNILYWGATR